MKRFNPGRGKALVGDLVQAHEQLHQDFLEHVRANRARTRTSASKELLPIFVVGDDMMVARVKKQGELIKLVNAWILTGSVS